MEYTDQTSGAIRLYLSRGFFNINQFTVLEKHSYVHIDTTLTMGILGESHFLYIEQGGEALSEICACVDADIENPENLIAHDFLPNLHTLPVAVAMGDRDYAFTFTYADWLHGLTLLAKLRNESLGKQTHILTHTFPRHSNSPHDPVTELYLTLNEKISLKTVHTYPNEQMMVFTESTLVKKNKLIH